MARFSALWALLGVAKWALVGGRRTVGLGEGIWVAVGGEVEQEERRRSVEYVLRVRATTSGPSGCRPGDPQ